LKGYCYFAHLLFSQLDESNSPHLPLQTRFLRPLIIFVVLNFLQLVHLPLVSLNFSQQQDIVDSYLACHHWNHWILSCRNATLAVKSTPHIYAVGYSYSNILSYCVFIENVSILSDHFFNL